LRASARPSTVVPLFAVIDVNAMIVPTNWVLVSSVAELATCQNVYAKLGGIVMPINGFGFHKADRPATSDEVVAATGRYHRHAIECFGAARCMFESNFPVDRQSVSYPVLWNAFKKIAAGASAGEKADLFHDTAHRAYRLA